MKTRKLRKVIVPPAECQYQTPNITDLLRKWDNRMRKDREVMGALEVAYMRGEHSGYLAGYRDAKKGKANRWLF